MYAYEPGLLIPSTVTLRLKFESSYSGENELMLKTTSCAALCVLFSHGIAAAQMPFTDFSAWEAAAGPSVQDDLSSYGEVDLVLGENSFFNGYSVTLAGTGTGNAGINGATNLVFTLGDELESMTFTFDQPVNGFGATWLNSFVSNGLTVTINGMPFNVEDSLPAANFEFLGFAGGAAFSDAVVTVTNAGAGTEFAAISDVFYSTVPTPIPSCLSLFSIVAWAVARRR